MSEDPKGHRPTRRAVVTVGVVAVAALALSSAWVLSGISRPTVTIVAIIPLSGVSSYLVEIGDSMSMVTERLNKWGGINGIHIRLIVEDCASSPQHALDRFTEAVDKYDPLAVITATREVAANMSVIAEERGVVLISVGASAEDLTEGKEWTFRYYVTPSDEAESALGTLDELDVGTLGILYVDDVYGSAVKNGLAEGFEASNGTVEAYGFDRTCADFSEVTASVADNEAVFVVGIRYQYQLVFAALNSSGYGGHVLSAIGGSIPTMWALPEAQGCYVNAPSLYMSSATVDDEFVSEFEERFGKPLTHQGAIGADVLGLIWGLLSDSEVSGENLKTLMDSGFVYSGILGVVAITSGSHNIDVPVHRATIQGGALQYI